MPRKPALNGYEDRLAESVVDSIIDTGDTIAAQSGPPPGTSTPSDRQKVKLWGRTDPAVDRDQLVEQLLATGVPREQMMGMQIARLYSKSHPDLVMAYGQPVQDQAVAEVLADLAAYPFRLSTFDHLDPKDRVKEAERLQRSWETFDGETMPGAASMPHPERETPADGEADWSY